MTLLFIGLIGLGVSPLKYIVTAKMKIVVQYNEKKHLKSLLSDKKQVRE